MNPPLPNRGQRRSSFIVDIALSTEQLKAFYAGSVSSVSARDRYGARIQFPLHSLRPFIGHEGVRGSFRLSVDESNKLSRIEKI